jgi:hypothetical protein
MKALAGLVTALFALGFCLPSYGEILVYKYTQKDTRFEQEDGQWEVEKRKCTGYMVIDLDYDDYTITQAELISCWKDPEVPWFEQDSVDLELVRFVYDGKVQWVIMEKETQLDGDDITGIIFTMLAGRARNKDIGADEAQEAASKLTGYSLRDEAGQDIEIASKISIKLYSSWTKYANREDDLETEKIEGLGQDYDATVEFIRAYLEEQGYQDQTQIVEWTRAVGTGSPGVFIVGEIPECWFSPTHYYIEPEIPIFFDSVQYDDEDRPIEYYASGTGDGHAIETHVYLGVYNTADQVIAFQEDRYYPESGNEYHIEVWGATYDDSGKVLDGYNVTVTKM